MSDEPVQLEERILDAFLARRPVAAEDRARADAEPELRALLDDLERLRSALDALPPATPEPALEVRTLALARRELAAAPRLAVALELARIGAAVAIPFLVVLVVHTALVLHGPALLGAWLPDFVPGALATWLPIAYAVSAAGWLALVLGSLPVLAHRTATRRMREVPT